MKKLLIIGLFLITILALCVSATENASLSAISTIKEKPSKDFQTTFTITNTGTDNLTVGLEIEGLSDFNIKFDSSQNIFIETGTSETITVNGTVYEKVETTRTGDQDGTTFSGTIKVKSGSTVLDSTPLNIVAECQLEFDDIEVEVDNDKEDLSDGDTISDVLPGSKVEFKGDIENLFTDEEDEDIKIEDVEVEIIIEEIDDEGDDDLEDTVDVGKIKPEEKESFTIEFEIPEDVEDGDYDVQINVVGEDENGATHEIEWKLTLEVEKERHYIKIKRADVSPSTVSCSRNFDIDVKLKNIGQKDEEEVVLIIESSALGIDEEYTSIPEIDEGTGDDTEYDQTYSFAIDDKVKAGVYPIKITVYYDTDEHSDDKTVDLRVESCVEEEEEPEDEEEEVIIVSPPSEEEEEEDLEILTTPVTETTEVSLLGSNTYMLFLFGAVGVAVIVIIIMVAVLFSIKKKQRQE